MQQYFKIKSYSVCVHYDVVHWFLWVLSVRNKTYIRFRICSQHLFQQNDVCQQDLPFKLWSGGRS